MLPPSRTLRDLWASGPYSKLRGHAKEGESLGSVCSHACAQPGTRRAEAPRSCGGSGIRSWGSSLKSRTTLSHSKEEILNLQKSSPDPETRSPHARRDLAPRRVEQWVLAARGSVAHVNLNLSQARGESLVRNYFRRSSIPVSQKNLAFSFYFPKSI